MTRKRRLSFASVLALATAVLLLTTAVVCVADIHNAYAGDATASVSVWDGSSSDTSWYDSSKTEFYITNAAQLAGFVAGANSNIDYPDKFAGKTVYLTTDIDLNNKELHDNNGINDDFAMKYSCENAKYAEIYYKDTATPANYGYTKVYNPNNKYICLSISKTNSSKNNIWIKTSTINFTDRVCWVKYFAEGDFINSTVTYINSIYVTKVILYF